MSYDSDRLSDYNDVASRIQEFREKYPTGCLRPADPARPYSIERIGDGEREQCFVVVVTAAYRTPDDPCPGVGTAWEVVPGRTPYTRGSEIMNAETSSWGRALIAVGAADARKGVASAEEVAARAPSRKRQATPKPMSEPMSRRLFGLLGDAGMRDRNDRLAYCSEVVGRELQSSTELTFDEGKLLIATLQEGINEAKTADPS